MEYLDDISEKELLKILKLRFENNIIRHPKISWQSVLKKLTNNPKKMWSLNEMERTGGEPDVVAFDDSTNEYLFYDCSKETPKDRINTCYDHEALLARKKFKPQNSAINMAETMGINILDEEEYRYLQTLGEFDLKTSSWLKTPNKIRELGGSLFGDRRYNHVFIYHNSASSYYSTRGFRGSLRI